jgi:Na+/proline symporter
MALSGVLVVNRLPENIGFTDALYLAGKSGKLNAITTDFNWHDKYNIWSGVIGGFFLSLSYFGTDQSQVGRYITAKDTSESRIGLLLNGLVKIPMQFLILLIGVLVFIYYSFNQADPYYNSKALNHYQTSEPDKASREIYRYNSLVNETRSRAAQVIAIRQSGNESTLTNTLALYEDAQRRKLQLRDSISHYISEKKYAPDKSDTNYIFLYFVKNSLPTGVVGLLFAVIILASWGSISAALNSLAASSLIDFSKRKPDDTPEAEVRKGRNHTLAWGLFCIGVAMFATKMGSLIEAVNILGSLFYGTILGIFLVALYLKRANGRITFVAAVIAELAVIGVYLTGWVSFLWLNVIGAGLVYLICLVVVPFYRPKQSSLPAQ